MYLGIRYTVIWCSLASFFIDQILRTFFWHKQQYGLFYTILPDEGHCVDTLLFETFVIPFLAFTCILTTLHYYICLAMLLSLLSVEHSTAFSVGYTNSVSTCILNISSNLVIMYMCIVNDVLIDRFHHFIFRSVILGILQFCSNKLPLGSWLAGE